MPRRRRPARAAGRGRARARRPEARGPDGRTARCRLAAARRRRRTPTAWRGRWRRPTIRWPASRGGGGGAPARCRRLAPTCSPLRQRRPRRPIPRPASAPPAGGWLLSASLAIAECGAMMGGVCVCWAEGGRAALHRAPAAAPEPPHPNLPPAARPRSLARSKLYTHRSSSGGPILTAAAAAAAGSGGSRSAGTHRPHRRHTPGWAPG